MTWLSCKTSPTVRFWLVFALPDKFFWARFSTQILHLDQKYCWTTIIDREILASELEHSSVQQKLLAVASEGTVKAAVHNINACKDRWMLRLRWTMVSKIHQFRTVQAGMMLPSTPLKNIPTKTCYSITSATLIVFYYLQIWFRSILTPV